MDNDKFRILEITCRPNPPLRVRQYGLWLFGNRCASPREMQQVTPCRNSFDGCPVRRFNFCSIAHLVAGRGQVWLEDGTERKMLPGDCVIVTEKTLNRYGGMAGESFVEDTISFAGPIAEMMQKSGVLRSCVFHLGQVRKIKLIHELLMQCTVDSHLAAAGKLQHLLMEVYFSSANEKKVSKQPLDELLAEIAEDPQKWWSVPELAEICGLSETHLRRLFIDKTGYAPKEYIDRLKLQMAGEMLHTTSNSIAKIAGSFGYVDPYHFSRRFKEIMGISPKFYRQLNPVKKT